jgi:dienelactone hydrolase
MLAQRGYTAFALDMYGKGVYAKDHEEAGKLAGAFFGDRAAMRKRALAGLAQLKAAPFVDETKIAAIGYCFGGTTVLELARAGTDLKGVASFHGNLATPTPATETPKAKILVLHGADDGFVNAALPGFIEEMRKVKADWQLNQYGGAVHSFTVKEAGNDPSKGMAYDAQADARSWAALGSFLEELFR